MISALIALAPALISPLIKAAEAIWGPKTGTTKFQTVFNALKPALEQLATAGKLPGIPDDASVTAAIEAVLADEKAKSPSLAPTTAIPAGHQLLYVPANAKLVSIEFFKE